jgi:hypothetical protein
MIDVWGASQEDGKVAVIRSTLEFKEMADVFGFFSCQLFENFFAAGIADDARSMFVKIHRILFRLDGELQGILHIEFLRHENLL